MERVASIKFMAYEFGMEKIFQKFGVCVKEFLLLLLLWKNDILYVIEFHRYWCYMNAHARYCPSH